MDRQLRRRGSVRSKKLSLPLKMKNAASHLSFCSIPTYHLRPSVRPYVHNMCALYVRECVSASNCYQPYCATILLKSSISLSTEEWEKKRKKEREEGRWGWGERGEASILVALHAITLSTVLTPPNLFLTVHWMEASEKMGTVETVSTCFLTTYVLVLLIECMQRHRTTKKV